MRSDPAQFEAKSQTPDPIDVYVGSRIKEIRKKLKINQTQLAKTLGVTYQQIQKYEAGTNRIGSSSLYKISVCLGVPISVFFQGIETVSSANVLSKNEADTHRLITTFLQITDHKVRQKILEFIQVLGSSRGL